MGDRSGAASGEANQGEEGRTLACEHCGRRLEWCSFCDRSDCPVPSCLACLVTALGESGTSLHSHGG
jgi:hypothetical protein